MTGVMVLTSSSQLCMRRSVRGMRCESLIAILSNQRVIVEDDRVIFVVQ